MRLMETFGETFVNSLHGSDVFGGDAEVVEIDLKVPVSKVFDLEVFGVVGVVFVVVVVVCQDEGCNTPVLIMLANHELTR